MPKRKWTDEQLKESINKSRSVSEVLRHLNVTNRATVMKRITELNLDTSRLRKVSSGLKMNQEPNAYWRRFKERLDNYDSVKVEDWGNEQYLGHILKRYKDYMDIDFTLSYSGPPSKCKEIYCIKKMVLSLGTEDPVIVKEYIDWIFDDVIIAQKVNVTSMAFFFMTNFILKFKAERRKKATISRATKLPDKFVDIVNNLNLDVKTYGDLAMAKIAIEKDPDNKDLQPYFSLFEKLKETNFDMNTLNKI